MAVVLVADDDEMIRKLAALALRAAGHEVVTARNGVEAVALYRSSPDRFDAVVTDIQMPVMDGREAVRLIRESRAGARILCMSGYAEDVPQGVEFLPKPFLPAQLSEHVARLLSGK